MPALGFSIDRDFSTRNYSRRRGGEKSRNTNAPCNARGRKPLEMYLALGLMALVIVIGWPDQVASIVNAVLHR